jgi:hypothetical protein
VKEDEAGRKAELTQLLPLVRFPMMAKPGPAMMAEPLAAQHPLFYQLLAETHEDFAESGEKHARLAQKLGQLQPILAIFPLECMGQLTYFGAKLTPFLASALAAACPRRRPRKGQRLGGVQPLAALAFTRALAGCYDVTGEGGTLLRAEPGSVYHPALCAGHKMSAGRHAAEFTILEASNTMIGVAQEGIKVTQSNANGGSLFWGIGRNRGRLHHRGNTTAWLEGTQPVDPFFGTGDVVGLLLDCDAGTLAVKKNGERLGVAATGVAGELCWAVAMHGGGNAARVRAVDADAF